MRYAISRHTGAPPGDHVDLFFQRGEALATWSVEGPDWTAATSARERAPHRTAYLDYAGEISGGRGRVEILERGTCDAETWTDREVWLRLTPSNGPARRVRLARESPGAGEGSAWRIEVLALPAPEM